MISYNISRTTQCTNRDNTARNDNFTIWLLIESDWSQVIYIYRYENILQIGEGALGYRIDAEISSKAAPEKPQTTVSENMIHFSEDWCFLYGHFIPSIVNRKQCVHPFWHTRYRAPLLQSCGIAECLCSFPPRLSVQIYLSSDDY